MILATKAVLCLVFLFAVAVVIITIVTHASKPQVEKVGSCCDVSHPIDVVFTWVDGTDPVWKNTKAQHEDKDTSSDVLANVRFNNAADAPDIELCTAIKSVLKNMPWVRTIYILTMRPQMPLCLLGKLRHEYTSGRIRLVHHDQIWPNPNDLPVFNSVAIESNMHRIPDLSEHFIYFNDDMIVGRVCSPNMFFCDGKAIQRGVWVPGRIMGVFPYNVIQSIAYQSNMSNTHSYFQPAHVAIALTKTMMLDCEKQYPQEFERIARQRFRGNNTVIPHFLAANLALGNQTAVVDPNDPVQFYVLNYSMQVFSRMVFDNGGINLRNMHMFCINDVPTKHQRKVHAIIQKSLN